MEKINKKMGNTSNPFEMIVLKKVCAYDTHNA